ncbi:MAG: membrane dipeptidase [Planctomycetaceae bacterium]|nr:membrane dipeptidase [Planctomycetaceae bacterium]
MPHGTSPTRTEADQFHRRDFLATAAALAALSLESSASGADVPEPSNPDRDPLLVTQNPVIARARDAALEVLKPSKAQLQRGLALHRDALVFDTYGFAPRAAVDGPALLAAAEAGATDAEWQNLQEEMGMTRAAAVAEERAEFAEAMACSGVTCIFQNAGEEGQDPLRLMKRLSRFTFLTDMLRGTLVRATRPDDIEAARAARRHCLYLTGNGVPLPQQWSTVEDELSYVRLFFHLGIRMMHVTYNRRNMLGDGCAETANGGLSDLGRAAIAEMNRVGVIADVAHSGWQTSLEAARASKRPMVASHTTCDALQHHIRAKPDEVIKAICDTGGLIGICCIPQFLGRTGDISALLDHIDYAVQKFGVEHVGIGTDVAHTSQHAASVKLPKREKRRTRFEALWPKDALGGTWPRAGSLGWTNWPLFTVGLVQRGYKDDDIRRILGGNMLRVCRAAWEAVPQLTPQN